MVPSISLSFLALLSSFLLALSTEPRGVGSAPANIVPNDDDGFFERPFNPFPPSHPSQESLKGDNGNRLFAGSARLTNKQEARMNFYYVKAVANNDKPPLLFHLTGGPGFSAAIAIFKENGPLVLDNGYWMNYNPFGFDQLANVLYVDQPMGTGYSIVANTSLIPTTSEAVIDDLSAFLMLFLEHHPELRSSELYIDGSSYAAHYIPPLTRRLLDQVGPKINLQGVAIASAWIDPPLQFSSYPDYLLKMGLVNQAQHDNMTAHVKVCSDLSRSACGDGALNWTACAEANQICNDILWDYVLNPLGNINYYDVTKKCVANDQSVANQSLCYDFSNVEKYMNLRGVKYVLGVDKDAEFVLWNSIVYDMMAGDQMRSFEKEFAALLDRGTIKVLVYGGEYDLICNSIGNLLWVNDMNWHGSYGFKSSRFMNLQVGGQTVGSVKSSGLLSLVNINNAGHFVGKDQPRAVLEMMKMWIRGSRRP